LITTNFTLLKNTEVIKWLFGDLSHISTNKDKKKKEDEWGKSILKIKRPDLKLNCQWTNKFGEHLAEEILQFCGEKNIKKPKKIKNYQPDLETDNFIVEVKTQTFFTEGTAGEKIMGAAFKYCEIPKLYGKPLKILIIGGAEKICREQYGCLKSQDIQKCSETKQLFLDFYASHNITFEGATEMLLKTLKEKAETVNMVKIYQKPLLKWVGGKTQILDEVLKHFPSECNNYIEPFIGGGSVLFAILSSNTVNIKGSIIAADKNEALISFYKNLQTNSSKLFSEYKSLVQKYNSLPMPAKKEDEKRKKTEEVADIDKVSDKSEYYYYYRKKFNDTNDKTTTESSALFLFLN
ncbi:MAG: hypothetical protein EBU93_07975, partial [Chlamydiae bacterium]|nr:hypothetical protein [Chlamydiota bacterium]